MPDRIACPTCGGRIDRPAGYTRKKIRCPGCGYYADTPPDWAAEPVPDEPAAAAPAAPPRRTATPVTTRKRADPRDTRPDFTPDAPAGDPLLAGSREEDDDRPYAVPGTGTGTRACPHCHEALPLDATLCVHCGRDVASGKRQKRAHQPMAGEWHEGFAPRTRLAILAGMQVFNVVFSLVMLVYSEDGVTVGGLVGQLFGQAFNVTLQAFLVGSYDTFTLRRTAKNQTFLTRTRRLAFIPLAPAKLPWKQSAYVGVIATHDPGIFTWLLCIYMLGMGCLPGVLFYWFVIRPETYTAALCDEYGSTTELLYRTQDREKAAEVAAIVGEATALKFKAVM